MSYRERELTYYRNKFLVLSLDEIRSYLPEDVKVKVFNSVYDMCNHYYHNKPAVIFGRMECRYLFSSNQFYVTEAYVSNMLYKIEIFVNKCSCITNLWDEVFKTNVEVLERFKQSCIPYNEEFIKEDLISKARKIIDTMDFDEVSEFINWFERRKNYA